MISVKSHARFLQDIIYARNAYCIYNLIISQKEIAQQQQQQKDSCTFDKNYARIYPKIM